MTTWADEARRALIQRHRDHRGWSYHDDGDLAVEPTVLASLALIARWNEDAETKGLAERSARWLAGRQGADGGVGPTAALTSAASWSTSYSLLLWTVLGVEGAAASRAAKWLLNHPGVTFQKPPGSPLGHDTSIPGWSWVEGTHSWVEPTALAILALRRAGFAGHSRVLSGLELIRDRAIPEGGWNFGNNTAFGASLRPKPGPTALALLAFAGVESRTPAVEKGLSYLRAAIPTVRAAQSLGLGLLALTAWKEKPKDAEFWLEESFGQLSSREDKSAQIAYLLLACAEQTLAVLGVEHA